MKTVKLKVVDFYKGFDANSWWVMNILRKHYNIEFSENPDFVIFSVFGNDFLNYNNCVKIFYTEENVIPNFNKCDYAITCHNINFGNRFFKKYCCPVTKNINDRSMVTEDLLNRRFCNFIYSNSSVGSQAQIRQDFAKKLMEYKHVDCPGRVLHNMDTDELEPRNGNWIASTIDFLKKYKFTIAFENSVGDGYITEKIFQPLQSLSVPIYCGTPDVVKEVNPRSFINCNDYNNDFDAIIERIKYLDTHDDEYLNMLREQPMQPDYDFNQRAKFERWLCDIIERGNIPFDKGTRPDWDVVAYKNKISKLTIDNQRLISDLKNNEGKANSQEIEKVISEIKKQTDDLTNNVLYKNIATIKKNYKKTRKYFNILFISNVLLFIIMLFILF